MSSKKKMGRNPFGAKTAQAPNRQAQTQTPHVPAPAKPASLLDEALSTLQARMWFFGIQLWVLTRSSLARS